MSSKNPKLRRSARIALVLACLAAAGPSRTLAAEPAAPAAAPKADEPMCVVAVQPEVKSVTFASPTSGLEGGALSLFLAEAPTVKPGDLVKIVRAAGAAPELETVEAGSAKCQSLAKGVEDHHAGH
ncbi:MAG: hypothetical protein FJ144_16005 [Deltaproteobacteria bacterium]|nr:hypothetical protein [Deltaproteobacteria bacterium]